MQLRILILKKSCLSQEKTAADVVISGYGFLSENADFAEELRKAGVLFAGPSSQTILDFGLKHRARYLAIDSGVPVVPGSGLLDDPEQLVQICSEIGYPVMLKSTVKSTAGGGSMGLKVCNNDKEVLINFLRLNHVRLLYFHIREYSWKSIFQRGII